MSIALTAATPSSVALAYQSIDAVGGATNETAPAGQDFGATLQRAVQSAIDVGEQAGAQATSAIMGHGNLTSVVTAVSRAELALQTTAALRDRMVQAYQDVMKMPI